LNFGDLMIALAATIGAGNNIIGVVGAVVTSGSAEIRGALGPGLL
jgi:hypothetical protein